MTVFCCQRTQEEWQIVFFIAAAVYVCGAIFYGIFGSGDLQVCNISFYWLLE